MLVTRVIEALDRDGTQETPKATPEHASFIFRVSWVSLLEDIGKLMRPSGFSTSILGLEGLLRVLPLFSESSFRYEFLQSVIDNS